MKSLMIAAGLLVAAVALMPRPAAAEHHRHVPEYLKNVHRIVTLGDSITQGGAHPGGYVWLIEHDLNALYPQHKFEVVNAGISGHKSIDMLARFQRDVVDKKPDLITFSVG